MFCPKCRIEYEDWVKECVECKIPLVSEIPEDKGQGEEIFSYKEILSTFNQGDVAIIKAVLDSEKVVHYFKGEYFNLMRPLVDPAVLMVREDQVEKAIELLKNYKLEYRGIITNPDEE